MSVSTLINQIAFKTSMNRTVRLTDVTIKWCLSMHVSLLASGCSLKLPRSSWRAIQFPPPLFSVLVAFPLYILGAFFSFFRFSSLPFFFFLPFQNLSFFFFSIPLLDQTVFCYMQILEMLSTIVLTLHAPFLLPHENDKAHEYFGCLSSFNWPL